MRRGNLRFAHLIAGWVVVLSSMLTSRADEAHKNSIDRDVRDLAADEVRFNAWHAMRRLCDAGLRAVSALDEGLSSADYQQRQLAAYTLCRISEYKPTRKMLRVLVEGLSDDNLPWERAGTSFLRHRHASNATAFTEYLLKHAREGRAFS